MKKENIVDLITYRNQHDNDPHSPVSQELQEAIQGLIKRMRELGPISSAQ